MKKPKQAFNQDSAFKELVMDFPEDSVRMLLPDLEKKYGPIEEVEFPRQEMKKQWLEDQGRELDIPIKVKCRFAEVVLILLEHKSDKKSFSIYKLAHYTLDLMELYPGCQIIPVALFTDQTEWRKDVARKLSLEALGQEWLSFTYLKLKLKEMSAEEAAESNNPVLQILTPFMRCEPEKQMNTLYRVYKKLKDLVSNRLYLKYVTFIDKYSKIEKEQRDQIKAELRSGQQGGHMLSEILLENKQQLEEKDRQLEEKDRQITDKDRQIIDKDRQITDKDRQIIDKDRQLEETVKSIAREMLRLGNPPEAIARATHLPLYVVEGLKKA